MISILKALNKFIVLSFIDASCKYYVLVILNIFFFLQLRKRKFIRCETCFETSILCIENSSNNVQFVIASIKTTITFVLRSSHKHISLFLFRFELVYFIYCSFHAIVSTNFLITILSLYINNLF